MNSKTEIQQTQCDSTSGDPISERVAELRIIARDDFIEIVSNTDALSTSPERQGFFLTNLDGEFTTPSLEEAFIGYCLGRAQAEEGEGCE